MIGPASSKAHRGKTALPSGASMPEDSYSSNTRLTVRPLNSQHRLSTRLAVA